MKDKGEIIVYQSENTLQLEVRMENETVWLTQAQMVELFQRDRTYSGRVNLIKKAMCIFCTLQILISRSCYIVSMLSYQ